MILFRSPVFKSTTNSFRFWSERPRNCRLEIGPVGPDPNTAYQFPFVDVAPGVDPDNGRPRCCEAEGR